jgi:CRISPR-associated endonuclease/helicase Cas3
MTHVDLSFPVRGHSIPRDHSYALYGALSRLIPELHGAGWLAVHGIGARLLGPETLTLHPPGSLRLRIPLDRIAAVLPLAGKLVEIAGRPLVIGVPSVVPLQPAPVLDARLVVIKLTGGVKREGLPFMSSDFRTRFMAEASRQLARLGIANEPRILGRSSITVAGRSIIGCAVQVDGLTEADSILLQVRGIGGKRTMGCGVFRPARSLRA